MKNNVAVSIGSLALIEKVNDEFNFFKRIFANVGGKAKNMISSTKLFIYNRLDECFSINQIIPGYSSELFELLNFKSLPSDRNLYRYLSRIGKNYTFILGNYQLFISKENLVADKQFIDFSSSYFEGKTAQKQPRTTRRLSNPHWTTHWTPPPNRLKPEFLVLKPVITTFGIATGHTGQLRVELIYQLVYQYL